MSIERFGNHWFGLLLLGLSLPLVAAQKPAGVISGNPYQKWIDEDARYIITDQEAADFKRLTSDPQRDDFIVTFWERRNPTPGAPKNSFKEEHCRRLAYTNTHYAATVAGYKTDRGRIYILYGPPDAVDKHFSAAAPEKPVVGSKDGAIPFDWELWHYLYIEGLGKDVAFKFVDTCGCGEYRMPIRMDELRKYSPK